jgi:hypothetical protein
VGVSGEVVVGIMADLWHHYEPNTSGTWSIVAGQNTLRKPIPGTSVIWHAIIAVRQS